MLNNTVKKNRSFFYIILGVCIIIFLFKNVFRSHGVLYFNDFVVPVSSDALQTYLNDINIINFNGNLRFNFFNEMLPLIYLYLISGFFEYELAVVIFFLSLLIIPFVVNYYVFKKISRKEFLSFSVGMFSILNLWSYDRFYQGHYFYYMFYSVFSSLYLYLLLFSHNKFKHIYMGLALFFCIFTYYQFAIILIYVTLMVFIFDLLFGKKRSLINYISGYLLTALISLLLAMPFLLPYLKFRSYFTSLSSSVYVRESLGYYAEASKITYFFGLARSGMGSYQQIKNIFELYIIGFFVFVAYSLTNVIFKDGKNVKISLILLILGFLSFGYWFNSHFYLYMFEKVPLLSTFRDMNKFVGVAIVLYIFLILNSIKNRNKLINIVSVVFLSLSLLPYLKGFNYYDKKEETFLYLNQDDVTLNYSISFPSYPIFFETVGNKNYHSYIPVISSFSNIKSIYVPFGYQNDYKSFNNLIFFKDIYSGNIDRETFKDSISRRGIKYIYLYKNIPYRTNEGFIDSWFKDFDGADFFGEKYFENEELVIFKNAFYYPFIFSKDISFQKVNNSKFKIYVKGLKQKQKIDFLDSYNENWKLFIKKNPENLWCKPLKDYKINSFNITECFHTNKFIDKEVFFNTNDIVLYEVGHAASDVSTNVWDLDPDYIRENFDSSFYKENEDGSIDVEIMLYFEPQRYFNYGILVSLATLLFLSICGFIYLPNKFRNRDLSSHE